MPHTIIPKNILEDKHITVFRLELPQPLPGYNKFLTPWLIKINHNSKPTNILVDPGPTASIPYLITQLQNMGISSLKWIFLTHIHIDHAGGTGNLCDFFPSAKVLVHPRGHDHLVSPKKLWEASLKTLGNLAYAYGEISPVPLESIVISGDKNGEPENVSILDTPGHASHHLAYLICVDEQRILFSGEAAGVFSYVGRSKHLYMRPATPPRFFYDVFMESINLLGKSNATTICCGHLGFSHEPNKIIKLHKKQLEKWKNIIQNHKHNSIPNIINELLQKDEHLRPFALLDEKVQKREKHFFVNNIKGFTGYLN